MALSSKRTHTSGCSGTGSPNTAVSVPAAWSRCMGLIAGSSELQWNCLLIIIASCLPLYGCREQLAQSLRIPPSRLRFFASEASRAASSLCTCWVGLCVRICPLLSLSLTCSRYNAEHGGCSCLVYSLRYPAVKPLDVDPLVWHGRA